ncbi:MAG TPA: J domain-containing protein [Blastocatellia bacterium]|nr:J domain-containing protein [Blastocatellia bacterium]
MAARKFDSNADYYAALGVSENASPEEIDRAFRKKARSHHPDRGGSEDAMKSLNEAHDILSDTETRRAYDEQRPPKVTPRPQQPRFDPYAARKAGTLGIPVSDPDLAGLIMGALACFGLGLPLLLLVEMQWVFVLWPLRLMSFGALCVGVYMAHSALALKHRRMKAANRTYPRSRFVLNEVLFWTIAVALIGAVVVLLYFT